MRVEFLGTGTSTGVPMIGCRCDVCRSKDSRDRRLRSSVCLTVDDKNILIDCGPDFRQQMLRSGIDHIDAVLLTHEHYDHTSGLDELRNFSRNNPIPIYAEPNVLDIIHQRLFYCFSKQPNPGVAHLELKAIENLSPFTLFGIDIGFPLSVTASDDLPILPICSRYPMGNAPSCRISILWLSMPYGISPIFRTRTSKVR